MPQRITCPDCGHALDISDHADERWLTCPLCLARLENPSRVASEAVSTTLPLRRRPIQPVEVEVQRGQTGTVLFIVLLAALLIVGFLLWMGGPRGRWQGFPSGLLLLFGLLEFLVVVAVLVWLLRGKTFQTPVGAAASAGVGKGCLAAAITLLMVAAGVIVFFATCVAQLNRLTFR